MKIKTTCLALSLFVLALRSYAANPRYYFEMSPIQGDATARHHEGAIVATGYELHIAPGSNSSFILQKGVDTASTDLAQAVLSGSNFATATFTAETGGERPRTIFKIDFTNPVAFVADSVDNGTSDPVPRERISFGFTSAVMTTYSGAGTKTVNINNAP